MNEHLRDRREHPDRRRRSTPPLSRFWLRGRRRGQRRGPDAVGVYVDRYRFEEWGLAGAAFLLSICDLFLTLVYVSLGGGEGNPIMALALEQGRSTFIAVKFWVTLLGVMFLLMHVRFRFVRASLVGIVVLYVALIFYHLFTWVPMAISSA